MLRSKSCVFVFSPPAPSFFSQQRGCVGPSPPPFHWAASMPGPALCKTETGSFHCDANTSVLLRTSSSNSSHKVSNKSACSSADGLLYKNHLHLHPCLCSIHKDVSRATGTSQQVFISVCVSHRLMARARFSISEFCCLISLAKLMITFSSWGISLGSVRLMFWYNVAAWSVLEDKTRKRQVAAKTFCYVSSVMYDRWIAGDVSFSIWVSNKLESEKQQL